MYQVLVTLVQACVVMRNSTSLCSGEEILCCVHVLALSHKQLGAKGPEKKEVDNDRSIKVYLLMSRHKLSYMPIENNPYYVPPPSLIFVTA